MIIQLIDERPPSVNHYWLTRRGGGRYISPEGEAFKELLGWNARIQNRGLKTDPDSKFEIEILFCWKDRRKRDVDNFSKVVLDALKGIVYADDDQIEVHLTGKIPANRDAVIIWIAPLEVSPLEKFRTEIRKLVA